MKRERFQQICEMLAREMQKDGQPPWLLIVSGGENGGTFTMGNTPPENQKQILRTVCNSFEIGTAREFNAVVDLKQGV